LARIASEWEGEALKAKEKGARKKSGGLLFEVRLIIFPNIMIHEGDGNDQGKISLPVALNHF
jgi:hypothetical protein